MTETLTEMTMGYFRSRVLSAAANLGIADALSDDERSVEELAKQCDADPASLHRLLRALASLGVVAETAPGRFELTPVGGPLRRDVSGSEWAAVVFWGDLLADNWSHLTECVRTGQNAARIMEKKGIASRWSTAPHAGDVFRAVMGTAPSEDYMPIVDAWDFSKYSIVADLGGGGGALIAAILDAYPAINGILADRQESVDRARARFASEGLQERCQLIAADLCTEVPRGAEVYLLKHVLHGYADDAAIQILRNCRSVLSESGRLLVIEFVLPDVIDRAGPELERRLMSDLNMLAVTGGKERTGVEWQSLLRRADLDCLRILPVPGNLASIIEAAPH